MNKRRHSITLTFAFAASVMAASLSAFPDRLAAQAGSTFRGTPERTGEYAGAGPKNAGHLQWRFAADGQLIASPAVDGERIYAASTAGTLYAIDRRSGSQVWKYTVKGRITSTPAVRDGRIYFAAYDGSFYALSSSDGSLAWSFQTESERRFTAKNLHGIQPAGELKPDPWDTYLSSPAIWEDKVYFGSGDGNVYALDARTGALRWKFHTGDVVHASPTIAKGIVYIGSWDRNFYALDARDGSEKWRYATGSDPQNHNQEGIQSSAAVVDGTVYFGSRDSHVYALDALSGAVKWINSTNYSWVLASPAVSQGVVYYPTSDSSKLFAVNAADGTVRFTVDFKGWPIFSSPAIADGVLYVGSTEGTLEAVDLKSKAISWSFSTNAAKAVGALYRRADGTSRYFDAFGNPPFSFYDDVMAVYNRLLETGSVLSSPVVADGHVYFGSTDGNLYALE